MQSFTHVYACIQACKPKINIFPCNLCTAKLYKVMLNECAEWEAMDITSVFDITKYIPNAIKKVLNTVAS